MAGPGGFSPVPEGLESYGGSGIFWYAPESFADFVLRVAWRISGPEDNSGVFLRIPPLDDEPQPAIEQGYEVQIDDRGLDPETGQLGSPLHVSGAVYRLAPAKVRASRPRRSWNTFEITARGPAIVVRLNEVEVSRLENGSRRISGHIGLQNHHEGSKVQFRDLLISRL